MVDSDNATMDRQRLDRRRLEEAHMKICTLDVFRRYPESFPTWSINYDMQSNLDAVTPIYYEAFATRYAGE